MTFGLEFPPISHLVEWPTIFGDGPFGVNKVILLMWISAALVFGLLYLAGTKQELVPRGIQNLAESTVEFLQENIIMQTIGTEGLRFTPFLLTLFTFILVGNLWEVIPIAQMPVNGRIALPLFMALVVYVLYHVVGVMSQGPVNYLKSIMFIPGVPKPMYILLTPIELVTRFFTQPFSLAVRLFANMLAGHLLLVSFAVITQALVVSTIVGGAIPLALLIFLMAFEVLVSVLQAYIFTILAAVYIDAAMHPMH
ncbi:MAG TPA: F0F1 ATP synthase subunit A [Acidimicrobiales bacterium]|nr:F0F1 ATP synthase subunit A [Acidimicrobiales bacterium]